MGNTGTRLTCKIWNNKKNRTSKARVEISSTVHIRQMSGTKTTFFPKIEIKYRNQKNQGVILYCEKHVRFEKKSEAQEDADFDLNYAFTYSNRKDGAVELTSFITILKKFGYIT